MDHSHHDHMHHMSSSGSDMHEEMYRCQMSMLFTWNTENLCLVFRWWHVSSTFTLLLSLLGVVALSAGYEYLRAVTRRYEAWVDSLPATTQSTTRPEENGEDYQETSSLLPGRAPASAKYQRYSKTHITKGILYGLQVFYSFFIMLLFMTYNGWVMIAVAVGAFLGYVFWGGQTAAKSVACH